MIKIDLPILHEHSVNWWRYTVRCPLCDAKGLAWQESPFLGWFLFDAEGEPHGCPVLKMDTYTRKQLREVGGAEND